MIEMNNSLIEQHEYKTSKTRIDKMSIQTVVHKQQVDKNRSCHPTTVQKGASIISASFPNHLGNPAIQRLITQHRKHNLQVISHVQTSINRHTDPDLFIRGDNYYFTNQGQARTAALAKATALGAGHTITRDPTPGRGLPHYHVVEPTGQRVKGHFFMARVVLTRNEDRLMSAKRQEKEKQWISHLNLW